jgi:hypothetical protein
VIHSIVREETVKAKSRDRAAKRGHLKLVKPAYTLCYGMRLDKGTGVERQHPHVPIQLPDGTSDTMALHVINGTPEEIKARLLQSIEAFFEIYAPAE